MATFEEFALRAGPAAVAKMEKISNVAPDAWPERVKLDFRRAGGAKDTLVWLPAREPLYKVLLSYCPDMYDLSLKYVDKESEEIVLNLSKHGVEEMRENVIGSSERLIVDWRSASRAEAVHVCTCKETERTSYNARARLVKAKMWISGGGKISDKDVLAAEKEVEKSGGRIVPSKGKAGLVQKYGCDLELWAEVCEHIQNELHLSDGEAAALKSAEHSDECEAFVLENLPASTELSTRAVAYRTVRDAPNNKIHVVYGRHELSVQAPFEPVGISLDRCVKLGNRIFAVLPTASPHLKTATTEMKDNPFVVPSGWAPVAASDKSVNAIVRDVVAPYYWGTSVVVLKGGDNNPFKGFYPAIQGDNAGKPSGDVSYLQDLGDGKYVFTASSCRLLVEAVHSQSPQLASAWKRYVQIRAQADWGSRLCLQAEEGDEA